MEPIAFVDEDGKIVLKTGVIISIQNVLEYRSEIFTEKTKLKKIGAFWSTEAMSIALLTFRSFTNTINKN